MLRNWLLAHSNKLLVGNKLEAMPHPIARNYPEESGRAINFTVEKANGGFVIQTRALQKSQNKHTDSEWITTTYIVTDDADFTKELGQIVTMEYLKG